MLREIKLRDRYAPRGKVGRVLAADVARGHSPPDWREWVGGVPGGLLLRGDTTGLVPIYAHRHPACLSVSTDLAALLDDLRARGTPPGLCPTGISHFLHHALVPLPWTVFEDVHFLGIGDRAHISLASGEISLSFTNDYPYLPERSREDRTPDPALLLELITRAIVRQLGPERAGFLMLSSGKDSTALALGLAEAGYADIPCVTFKAGAKDEEHRHAAGLCRRLGLRHETVELGLGDPGVEDRLRRFFAESPVPCGDFAQIPYVLCVSRFAPTTRAVLDGSGNDAYMGYVPCLKDRLKWRFALGHNGLARLFASLIGPESGWNYFLRSPAAATLPGRTLRQVDTRSFYSESVDTGAWWQQLSDEWSHVDQIAFRNAPIERHVDQAEIALKLRLAAAFRGQRALLPFCDRELVEYCFQLPEPARFDRKAHLNKLLLREMLKRFSGYDAKAIGKGFFEFDGARFLLEHRRFVVDEIERCALWEPRVVRRVDAWLTRMSRRLLLYHAVLPLFMLSGWYNHSRFLEDRVPRRFRLASRGPR